MKKAGLSSMPCPLGRALDAVGDARTLLLLRDSIFFGVTRFEEADSALAPVELVHTRCGHDFAQPSVCPTCGDRPNPDEIWLSVPMPEPPARSRR